MVDRGDVVCPKCGGILSHYDKVKRVIKHQNGEKEIKIINRSKCKTCKKTHRELPIEVIPYKHYAKEIINGVIEGYITPDTYGFEDYPCEMTMTRWLKSRKQQLVL